jgi:hypothetical protein
VGDAIRRQIAFGRAGDMTVDGMNIDDALLGLGCAKTKGKNQYADYNKKGLLVACIHGTSLVL